ncbi:DNA repair protein RecO [Uliginosibacterium paludis]|uniref:DNA repair protein RecO n=1 Tax=Uliginosibacterium paludis TaxID=1615952 RepID=A0ABV2CLP6_9RHOO
MSGRARIDNETGFLLHSYPWRETSLIVEIFSRDFGRVPMVAKGARRQGSVLRGALMAFQPLELTWSGKAEVKNLHSAAWQGGQPLLGGVGLLCGYYLNELLLRLLPREDAHPALFDAYAGTLARLAAGLAHEPLLRAFELDLLRELGYAPTLTHDADSGEAIHAGSDYLFVLERGLIEAPPMASVPADLVVLPGHVLLAMAAGDFSSAEILSHAKGLMRRLIHYHLGGQALESRRILMELQAL